MAAELLSDLSRATDSNSAPIAGAKWYFYETGTTTPLSAYTTAALTTAHPNPVSADQGGLFPAIYFDASKQYRGVLKNAAGSVIRDIDPVNTALISSLTAASGASMIGAGGGATVQEKLDELRGDAIYASAYDDLDSLLDAWIATGGTLVIDRSFDFSEYLGARYLIGGKTYAIRVVGKQSLTYTGAVQIPAVLRLTNGTESVAGGACPIDFEGDLTIDGGAKANKSLWLEFNYTTGANRRDVRVKGFTVQNCRWTAEGGSDAIGLVHTGGADHLVFEGIKCLNISRAAGVNTGGSNGCGGITHNGSAGDAQALHIVVKDCIVDGVTTGDGISTANYGDCDGIRLFQFLGTGTPGTAPVIERCLIKDCHGRAIKMFSERGGGVVRDVEVVRSNPGGNDIALQHGDGLVENITFRYSGNAHAASALLKTTCIGFSNSYTGGFRPSGYPFGATTVRNVNIVDTTGVAKEYILSFFDNNTTSLLQPRSIYVENLADSGSAENLFRVGGLGNTGRADIRLVNVRGTITSALTKSDDSLPNICVFLSGVRNAGSTVPTITLLNGSAYPYANTTAQFKHDGTTTGITLP